MLNFLFRGRKGGKPVPQREAVKRLIIDLNGILQQMADKPKIIVDPNTGILDLQLPDQMPDEALALPAPEEEKEAA